jgi:hypothetical protein
MWQDLNDLQRDFGPGNALVTILYDSASRYEWKMFNREFWDCQGLPEPEWLEPTLPDDIVVALERAKEKAE